MKNSIVEPLTARHDCAFCRGWYELADIGVVHSVPMCEVFKMLPADVFALSVRTAWQRLRGILPPVTI